jgi:hypothetical protein
VSSSLPVANALGSKLANKNRDKNIFAFNFQNLSIIAATRFPATGKAARGPNAR